MQKIFGNIFPSFSRSNSPSKFGGGKFSKIARKLESPASGRVLELTKKDVRNLKALWHGNIRRIIPQDARDINSDYIWLEVFRRIFRANSGLKSVFGWMDLDVEDEEEFNSDEALLKHCELFGRLWHEIVSTLIRKGVTELEHEELIFKIRQVGSAHSRNSAISFDAESWLCFKNALLDTFCPENGEFFYSRDAWNKVLTFTFSEMKQAFLQGITRRHSHCSTAGSQMINEALEMTHKRARSEKKIRKMPNNLRAQLQVEVAGVVACHGGLSKSASAYFTSSGPFQRAGTEDSLVSSGDPLEMFGTPDTGSFDISFENTKQHEIPIISVTLF